MNRNRTWLLGGMIVLIAGAFGVYLLARPGFCDGIPRSYGACAPDRPSYSGTTCDEVAVEWGRQLDERVIEIIDGPSSRGGQSRSSLLLDVEALTTQLANKHLRDNGLTPACTVESFMAAGEAQFSERLTEDVGTIMYQGSPVVEYSEWRQRVEALVATILSDPHAPYVGVS